MSTAGKTLWPLDQIVADTQLYVRDAVIDYVGAQTAAINPQVEGRLEFLTDNTAPRLTLPGDLAVAATGASGAVVTYEANATDEVAGPVPVTCTPASGSTFPVGVTTVTCTAKDRAGNRALGTFAVAVTVTPGVVDPGVPNPGVTDPGVPDPGAGPVDPQSIRAGLRLRNGKGGRDIVRVTAPDEARGALVRLYRITRSGKRVLVAKKMAGSSGDAKLVVADRRTRRMTKYVALVGPTTLTLADWTPKRRLV